MTALLILDLSATKTCPDVPVFHQSCSVERAQVRAARRQHNDKRWFWWEAKTSIIRETVWP